MKMATVNFNPTLILAMVNLESERANKIQKELTRLQSIGYLNSQTGLDLAKTARQHMQKAYDLLEHLSTPEATVLRRLIVDTMLVQERIIARIEVAMLMT